jgi:hypothetical protein
MQAMTVFCYSNEFRAVNRRGYCWRAFFCRVARRPIRAPMAAELLGDFRPRRGPWGVHM